jgi:polyisoprenoid-binding protein YceI
MKWLSKSAAWFALTLVCAAMAVAATGWRLDPPQSRLSFTGTQAGAPFEGVFQQFTTDIRFDPADLPSSRFDVTIDLKSVDSKDKDRDSTIKGPDIFATERWPASHFLAEKFTDKGGGKYAAMGKLTLRNVSKDVPIEFTFQRDATGAWLKGGAALKRLDFGVGQGDWSSTEWVGNDVKIQFALKLKP